MWRRALQRLHVHYARQRLDRSRDLDRTRDLTPPAADGAIGYWTASFGLAFTRSLSSLFLRLRFRQRIRFAQ